jgi:hypothetical protein
LTIRRARRNPGELGSLELFAELDEPGEPDVALNDARRIDAAASRFVLGLRTSLEIPSRLQGWRIEGMFAAVVLALGGARLVAVEDAGPAYYFDDAEGPVKAPDFRVVTNAGDHLLVEVKSVGPADSLKRQTISKAELEGARRYAEWTGARLLVAHYWSGPNLWTLVDPDTFVSRSGKPFVTLEEAMPASEFGTLGDAWIGTTPPLVLSLVADQAEPRHIEEAQGERHAHFVIGAVEMSCQGRQIESRLERTIAWSLMAFGGWHMEESVNVDEGGNVLQLDYSFEPAEPVESPQGFEIVSPLSSLYSALYNLATLNEAGEVASLRRRPEPDALVDLIPDDYWNMPDRALPIWRLKLKPRR